MMRTRLLWFASGFSTAAAAYSYFVYRDLWIDRQSLSSEFDHKFGSLETRLSTLEQTHHDKLNPLQDEGNSN